MWADVRPLRQAGRPLERALVRTAAPHRGELNVFKRQDPWQGRWVPVAALVCADGSSYLLPPLDQVRIARWTGPDLVLVGVEEPDARNPGTRHLQSWWCRLVAVAQR